MTDSLHPQELPDVNLGRSDDHARDFDGSCACGRDHSNKFEGGAEDRAVVRANEKPVPALDAAFSYGSGGAALFNPPLASFDVVLLRDHEASLNAIHALALDDSLSHEERLLAIERMARVRP